MNFLNSSRIRRPAQSYRLFCFVLLMSLAGVGCGAAKNNAPKTIPVFDAATEEASVRAELKLRPNDLSLQTRLAELLMARGDLRGAREIALPLFTEFRMGNTAGQNRELEGRIGHVCGEIHMAEDRPDLASDAWSRSRNIDRDLVPDDAYLDALTRAAALYESARSFGKLTNTILAIRRVDPTHRLADQKTLMSAQRRHAESLRLGGDLAGALQIYETLQQDEDDSYALGLLYMQTGALDKATALFDNLVASAGDSAPSLLFRIITDSLFYGVTEIGVSYYSRAVEAANRAKQGTAVCALAVQAFLLDLPEEAERQLSNCFENYPKGRNFARVAALDIAQQEYPKIAIRMLEKEMDSAPDWRTGLRLVSIYLQQGSRDDAMRLLKSMPIDIGAISVLSDAADLLYEDRELTAIFYRRAAKAGISEAWFLLGEHLLKGAQRKEARQALRKYTKTDKNPERHARVAKLYTAHKLHDDAARAIRRVPRPSPEVADQIDSLYLPAGRGDELYERWIRARGNQPRDFYQAGVALIELDPMLAKQYLERASKAGVIDAYARLVKLHADSGAWKEAKNAAHAYIDISGSRLAAREVYKVFSEAGNPEYAEPMLLEMISRMPTEVGNYHDLAVLYAAQGRFDDAVALWRKYVQSAADVALALKSVATHAEPPTAIRLLQEFAENEDPPSLVYLLLGNLHGVQRNRHVPKRATEQVTVRKYYERYLQQPLTQDELLAFAKQMYRSGNWDLASAAFERAKVDGSAELTVVTEFARALFYVGRPRDAEALIRSFSEQAGYSTELIGVLLEFRRFDVAYRYLDELTRTEPYRLDLFRGLVLTLIATGRHSEVVARTEVFLAAAPRDERSVDAALRLLTAFGLHAAAKRIYLRWGAADHHLQWAVLFRRLEGDTEGAAHEIKEHAMSINTPAVWKETAEALWKLDDYEGVQFALKQNGETPVREASLRLLAGLFWQTKQPSFFRSSYEVDLFRLGGYLEESRAVARRAAEDESLSIFPALRSELAGMTVKQIQDTHPMRNFSVETQIEHLLALSFPRAAMELVQKEIRNGRHVEAADFAYRHSREFIDGLGLDEFLAMTKSLRTDALSLKIGREHLAAGKYSLSKQFFKNVPSKQGVRGYAQTAHLFGGEFELALQSFGARKHSWPGVAVQAFLNEATLAGLGDPVRWRAAVLSAADPIFLPIHVRFALEGGRVAEAIRIVRDASSVKGGAQRTADQQALRLKPLLAEFAIAGHQKEALDLLAGLPTDVRSAKSLQGLELRIRAFAPGGAKALMSASERTSESLRGRWARLNIAKLALAAGHHDVVRQIAEPLLNAAEPNSLLDVVNSNHPAEHLATHHGVDLAADEALRLMIGLAYVDPNVDIDRIVQRYLNGKHGNFGAIDRIAQLLSIHGFHKRAVDIQTKLAERFPSGPNLQHAVVVAHRAGEPSTDRRFEMFPWKPRPSKSLRHLPVPVARELIERHEERPKSVPAIFERALWHYDQGEVELARKTLRTFIGERDHDPELVMWTAKLLYEEGLHGEVVGWLVSDTSGYADTLMVAGLSHIEIGREDRGIGYLDSALAKSGNPPREALTIANELLAAGHYKLAKRYASVAVESGDGGAVGFVIRSAAAISLNDAKLAKADLDRAMDIGTPLTSSLPVVMFHALKNDHLSFATPYLTQLLRTPANTLGPIAKPGAMIVIELFVDSGRAEEGVAFVEREAIDLFSINDYHIRRVLSDLYETAGRLERAYSFHRSELNEYRYSSPGDVPAVLNNLAYQFARTGKHLDVGMKHIKLAIALASERDLAIVPNYVATRAWLHFRKGELKEAEADIREALRISNAEPHGLLRRMNHFAEILRAQGKFAELAKVELRLERLRFQLRRNIEIPEVRVE